MTGALFTPISAILNMIPYNWEWLWGAIGWVLAVPITAAFKSVCDNVESLKPGGDFLGEA